MKKRQADARKQMAQTNLHAVLAAEDVEVLRTTAEAAWRSEGDLERLRAMAVHATLVRIRAMKTVGELRQLGLEVVETAGMDALRAMAVETAVRDGADVKVGRAVEQAAVDGEAEVEPERWLVTAARRGHVETTRSLLAAGAAVNHADNNGWTALHTAAEEGHVETMKALLAAGAEVNHADNDGETALYAAAKQGHVEAIQTLLAAGADPNRASNDGSTPLAAARDAKFEAAVQALVQAGATA